MPGLRHSLVCLLSCLAVSACVDRPAPEDSDSDGSTATTTATTTATPPTGTTGPDSASAGATETTTDALPGVHAGPCKPVDGDSCPEGHVCCSDDPATIHGLLPNYYEDGTIDDLVGTPLFSDANNDRSYWGFCVEVGGFPSPLGNGCPVPCNPTWAPDQIALMCGAGTGCCPFTAVDPNKDCVLDPDTQRWRTARGSDIFSGISEWGEVLATNQDPNAQSCEQMFGGDPEGVNDCLMQLTVADQRGYCFNAACPCVEDVCDQKNPDWVSRCG